MSAPLFDGVYKIVSILDDKKVLEVKGGKANVGTPVDLWQDNDKPHQRWQLTKVDEENSEIFYIIGHLESGLAMEAPGRVINDTANGSSSRCPGSRIFTQS